MQHFNKHVEKGSISHDLFVQVRVIVRTSPVVVGIMYCQDAIVQ